MIGKHYNAGATAGLIDQKHAEAMGPSAVFLFMWCLRRQTGATKDGWGVVLYGRPITYEHIHQETKFPIRTLERWMSVLVEAGYLKTIRKQYGIVILIANQKKFKPGKRFISTAFSTSRSAKSGISHPPKVADLSTKVGGSEISVSSATHTNHNNLREQKSPLDVKDLEVKVFKKEREPAAVAAAPVPVSEIQNPKPKTAEDARLEFFRLLRDVAQSKAMEPTERKSELELSRKRDEIQAKAAEYARTRVSVA